MQTTNITYNDIYTDEQRIDTEGYTRITDAIAQHLEGWKQSHRDKDSFSNRYRYLVKGNYTLRLSIEPMPNRKEYLNPRLNISGSLHYPRPNNHYR